MTGRIIHGDATQEAWDNAAPEPGTKCDSCGRRVPYPKKATSPKTKPVAYRAPLDEIDAHLEAIDAVADLLGVTGEKYHRFVAINYCLAVVLQGGVLSEEGA